MNRREIIQYIRQKSVVSEEQKISLINMLYNHSNNFGSLCGWIKSLNVLASKTFRELLSFERIEVVKMLIQGAEESISKDTFGRLVEIFFGRESILSGAILNQLQKEKEYRVKALLVQLLFHFCNRPIEGSSVGDYLAGLHNRDEIFRCKILHFLYAYYGGEALPLILKEATNIIPPPSLFFCMTLNHYLRLHPEIKWDEDIQKTIWSKMNSSRNEITKNGIDALFGQMQNSICRHEFLSLFHVCEQPKLQISNGSSRDIASEQFERFKKINSFGTEVKNVSFHNNQNRDIGSGNSKKDPIRFEI